jgi:hypothetical protein
VRARVAVATALGLWANLVTSGEGVGRCDSPRPRVHVQIDGCGAGEDAEIQRILGIELRAELGEAVPGAASDTTNVQVVCGETTELRVADPITGKSLVRKIDLTGSAPRARARLIALAASELVSTSWTELELTPRPAVPPAGPPPSLAAVGAAREVVVTRSPSLAPRSFRILAVFAGFVRTEGGGPLLGGGVRVGLGDSARPLGFGLDLLAQHSSDDSTALGSVSIESLSTAPVLLYHRSVGTRATLFGGAGARVGLARLTGVPANLATVQASTRAGPWLGPMIELGLGVTPAAHVRLEVAVELGDALAAVTGKVESASVGIQGPWLGLVLGAGVVP